MSTTSVHPSIYVLLGCPGSGKGTFAQAIKPEGYNHISTGDLTREEVRKKTEWGLKHEYAILNHIIGGIPFEEIQKLVEQKLQEALLEQKGVILDGYPKTLEQCLLLDRFIQKNELNDKVVVVLLDAEEEAVIDRILCRQTCDKCGKLYNSKFSPSKILDKCDRDDCDGTVAKRMDDDAEANVKRVKGFKDSMRPVLDYYQSGNRLNRLDANASPDVCLAEFCKFHREQTPTKI